METDKREYSDKEIEQMKVKMLDHYTSQIPLLTAQCTVEELLTRIEKAKFERLEARLKFIHLELNSKKPKEEKKTPPGNKK